MLNINNYCSFEGRIAKDPEFKSFGQGQNQFDVAYFNLAVDRSLSKDQRDKVKAGDKSIVTADFISMKASGGKADIIKNYFCKGKPIKILATYQTWITDDGNGGKKYGHIFDVSDIGFVLKDTTDQQGGNNNGGSYQNNNSNKGNNSYNNNNNKGKGKPANYQDDDIFMPVDDDEIPF